MDTGAGCSVVVTRDHTSDLSLFSVEVAAFRDRALSV